MAKEDLRCARCGGELIKGILAISLDGAVTPVFWMSGELERERLTRAAVTEGRERIPVVTYRCTACGQLGSLNAD